MKGTHLSIRRVVRSSRIGLAAALFAPILGGCDGSDELVFCPDVQVYGLAISAVDEPTGTPVTEFTAVVRDGPFVDTLYATGQRRVYAAMGRAGVYEIRVDDVIGYGDATVRNVVVDRGSCLVNQEVVTVELPRRFTTLDSVVIVDDPIS